MVNKFKDNAIIWNSLNNESHIITKMKDEISIYSGLMQIAV